MKFAKLYKKKLIIFFAVLISVLSISYIQAILVIPSKILLLEGEEYTYNFKTPFFVNIKADKVGVIKLNNGDINSEGSYCKLFSPIQLKTQKNGSVNLKMKIFGLIPFKTMMVDIVPNKKIIACGNTIGVKMKIQGILVIGVSNVETAEDRHVFPAKESGIKIGDLIISVNGRELDSVEDLISEIEKSGGNKIIVTYRRGSGCYETQIKPVKSIDDSKYHIGLWVRDSAAGIGTLTFYDPESKEFGALGHGISDIDTGTLMPIDCGEILESSILAVKKGKAGAPGELKGIFVEDGKQLGIIKSNSETGIYGYLTDDAYSKLPKRMYSISIRAEVVEGPATILANIDGNKVEEYAIEIQKVSRQGLTGSKGMIIKITDKRLLDATGGIVQGMSGSPIIQGNKIVGAVTHVLINDPTRGYGIFIENMLRNINQGNNILSDEKAS